jgi:hypothetical protein
MSGGSKSKNKGSTWERQCSKIFAGIFGGSWVRAAGSGAMIGGKNNWRAAVMSNNQTTSMKGDITPPDDMTHLCIEAKSYKGFAFHLLLTGDQKTLDSWIEQNDIVKGENDISLICMKFNQIGCYIATEFKPEYVLKSHVDYYGKHGHYVFCKLEEFLEDNKEILKKH